MHWYGRILRLRIQSFIHSSTLPFIFLSYSLPPYLTESRFHLCNSSPHSTSDSINLCDGNRLSVLVSVLPSMSPRLSLSMSVSMCNTSLTDMWRVQVTLAGTDLRCGREAAQHARVPHPPPARGRATQTHPEDAADEFHLQAAGRLQVSDSL